MRPHRRHVWLPDLEVPAGIVRPTAQLIFLLAAGNWVHNNAKFRAAELFRRVDGNDPANSAIVLVPMSAIGTEAQGQDIVDLASLEADANFAERTTGGWVRKVLTDADLAAPAPDHTNNRYPITLPQVTWTGPTAGNDTAGLAVCYDGDTTAGTDSNIEVLTVHDFVVATDGNDVILNAGDAARAS